MNERQARQALLKEGVSVTDPIVDIIDAILEHINPSICTEEAEDIAIQLADIIAE